MEHSHVVPHDNVKLDGFFAINHSPISTIYLSVEEVELTCSPYSILSLQVGYPTAYVAYGISYATKRRVWGLYPYVFTGSGTIVQFLHNLWKDMPDGTRAYLFAYDEAGKALPIGCPPPPEVAGLTPRLLAVICKT